MGLIQSATDAFEDLARQIFECKRLPSSFLHSALQRYFPVKGNEIYYLFPRMYLSTNSNPDVKRWEFLLNRVLSVVERIIGGKMKVRSKRRMLAMSLSDFKGYRATVC